MSRSRKRRVAKPKMDTSINGGILDEEGFLKVERDEVSVKIDHITWILVSREKYELLGEEGCRANFNSTLRISRNASDSR